MRYQFLPKISQPVCSLMASFILPTFINVTFYDAFFKFWAFVAFVGLQGALNCTCLILLGLPCYWCEWWTEFFCHGSSNCVVLSPTFRVVCHFVSVRVCMYACGGLGLRKFSLFILFLALVGGILLLAVDHQYLPSICPFLFCIV